MSDAGRLYSYVLGSIDDDFEDFEMIVYEVSRWAEEDGIPPFSEVEIWETLQRLLVSGEVRACRYRRDGTFIPVKTVPVSGQEEGVYYITAGKAQSRGL
jgi:hypothetical protein